MHPLKDTQIQSSRLTISAKVHKRPRLQNWAAFWKQVGRVFLQPYGPFFNTKIQFFDSHCCASVYEGIVKGHTGRALRNQQQRPRVSICSFDLNVFFSKLLLIIMKESPLIKVHKKAKNLQNHLNVQSKKEDEVKRLIRKSAQESIAHRKRWAEQTCALIDRSTAEANAFSEGLEQLKSLFAPRESHSPASNPRPVDGATFRTSADWEPAQPPWHAQQSTQDSHTAGNYCPPCSDKPYDPLSQESCVSMAILLFVLLLYIETGKKFNVINEIIAIDEVRKVLALLYVSVIIIALRSWSRKFKQSL